MKAERDLIIKHVINVFNEIAESYSHLRHRPWRKVIHELISRIPPEGGKVIVDIGAGSGRHSIALAKLGFEVIPIDISFNMLKKLVRRSKRERVEARTHVIVCDMCNISMRDSVSTGIIAVASIHHIPSKAGRVKAVKEMYRIARSNAPIVITVWSLLQPKLFLKALYYRLVGRVKEFGDVLIPWRHRGVELKRYYHLFTRRELINIAREGGLNIIHCCTYNPKSTIFPQNYMLVAKR